MEFSDQVIVEIGPGSGKQAEMLMKAHPGLTILLFDLPTQLYVCNQYLKKVFEVEDLVVDYRKGRNVEAFPDVQLGKINILPHWKFSILDGVNFDLLWNAASFQEMALETSKRYLKTARGAAAMYLMHNIKYRGLQKFPGERGVISPDFISSHTEIDRQPANLALKPFTWLYHDSLWLTAVQQSESAYE